MSIFAKLYFLPRQFVFALELSPTAHIKKELVKLTLILLREVHKIMVLSGHSTLQVTLALI
jgi:uncharacterized membrane protein